MKKKIIWILLNGSTLTLLYLGLFQNQVWALNAWKFLVWFFLVIYVLAILNTEARAAAQKSGHTVPVSFKFAYDLIVAVTLAAFGMFFYASLVMVGWMLDMGLHSDLDEKKEAQGE